MEPNKELSTEEADLGEATGLELPEPEKVSVQSMSAAASMRESGPNGPNGH